MKHQNKKGFTIVELVIVIAVIAILAAVLIPTFSSIVKKAQVSNDNQLVRSLNVAVSATGKKPANMTDALDLAKDAGIDLAKIVKNKAAENKILWDSENNRFCYLDKDGNITYNGSETPATKPADVAYWIVSDQVSDVYSTYYIGTATKIETSKGFDVGLSKVAEVKYTNKDDAQTVAIRTGSGTLTVDAPNDTVYHYGKADTVEVIAIANASFHAFGTVGEAIVKAGRFVAESTATIAAIEILPTAKVNVSVSTGAQVWNAVVDAASVANLEANIPVVEVENLAGELAKENPVETVAAIAAAVDQVKEVIKDAEDNKASSEVHTHSWGGVETVNATTDAPGYTYQVCSGCGERNVLSVIPMKVEATQTDDTTGNTGASISSGTTTPIKPITNTSYVEIKTADDLIDFRNAYNQGRYKDSNPTVILTADIDLDKEWIAIGTYAAPFHGTFNGNGHTISGLKRKTSAGTTFYAAGHTIGTGEYFGLFGIVGGGNVVIKDLKLDDVKIDMSDINGKHVAALIGLAPNNNYFRESGLYDASNTLGDHDITIENVDVSGDIKGYQHVAALAGKIYSHGKVTITGCDIIDANVAATSDFAGMLFGYMIPNGNRLADGTKQKVTDGYAVITGNTISGSLNYDSVNEKAVGGGSAILGVLGGTSTGEYDTLTLTGNKLLAGSYKIGTTTTGEDLLGTGVTYKKQAEAFAEAAGCTKSYNDETKILTVTE